MSTRSEKAPTAVEMERSQSRGISLCIRRLLHSWSGGASLNRSDALVGLLDQAQLASLDHFDRIQLEQVIEAYRQCRTLSDAGRMLFDQSRSRKATANDADRLRKYLGRFGLEWGTITGKP